MFNKILSWVSVAALLGSYAATAIGEIKPALGQAIGTIAGGILAFTRSILSPVNKDIK